MYNLPKYKFILDVNGAKSIVYPLYNEKISIEEEKEGEQEFFRRKFSGKLTFIKRDYNLIHDAPFDSFYSLEIQARNYETGVYEHYYTGGFVRTDVQFFQGDGEVEKAELKKLTTYDVYKPVLDGLRNELNLIDLMPDRSSLEYNNRPLWQFYIMNGTHVLNVLGGTYWETEVEPTDDFDLIYNKSRFRERLVYGSIDGVSTTISVFARTLHNVPNIKSKPEWNLLHIDVENFVINEFDMIGQEATGYKYVIRWDQDWNDVPQFAFISQKIQDEISQYGRVSQGCSNAGKFFAQETRGTNNYNAIPLNKAVWGCYSTWINYEAIQDFYSVPYFADALMNEIITYPFVYRLSEVIRVLVKALNPDVTHQSTPEYSEFLYGTDKNNIISGEQYTLLLTPKSNFLTLNADQPATRSLITLDDLLKDLFATHKLKWHIDEENRFRIEHIVWYDNGGRYVGSANIQLDLTNYFSRKTQKVWIYQQNNIEFDKGEMPERYQFEWSEPVSPAFEGEPIQVVSNYVEQGVKAEIGVKIFTTDVEYMIANRGDISKGNYALFAGIVNGDLNELSGSDSDMSAVNNWKQFGTTTFNVNNTVGGKMWVNIPLSGVAYNGVYIQPNKHGGVYEKLNTYDIKFKCKKLSAENLTLGIYRYDELQGAVYITFEPTLIEETFEFKNVVANSELFIIKAPFLTADATFTIDDVVITAANTFRMPLKEFVIKNFIYHLQNSDLAWYFIHEKFWKYSMPAPNIIVNGLATTAETLAKRREQEVEFPLLTDPNNLELIKTSNGNGEIKKLSINLLSRKIKALLKYDTE